MGGGVIISSKTKTKEKKERDLTSTIEERLFVHLMNFNDQRDKYVVSVLLTQKGICGYFECSVSHISRVLKQNEIQGFIYRKKVHIKDEKIKQYAFFLTEEGIYKGVELSSVLK
jgi:CRP-like cAMP-binding protein